MGRVTLLFVVIFLSTLITLGDSCSGRVVFTDETGKIDSGNKEYPKYARCEWLIDAQATNKTIYLEFESLDTECSYDFLFVFDGHSYEDKMLASFSGDSLPQPVIARSGKMLVYLFSDRNYQKNGFRARYSIQDCPLNCSGHGQCVDRQCLCLHGYAGQACHLELCPNNCGEHGVCTVEDNSTFCLCDQGFSGYMCNISLNDSHGTETWYSVVPHGLGFEARSAHAGATMPDSQCLYIFGGFTLDHVLNDLMRFCFDTNSWEKMNQSSPWPQGRYEHAIVQYGYGFYMFGGIMPNGTFSNELWYYNAELHEWTLCAENSTTHPIPVSGHSFTAVENYLYVFGGKSVNGQFWSNMFKINGDEPEHWEEVIPLGGKSARRRLVGHSTVYHKESKSLIIFGGYSYSDQPRFGSHTKQLHMFHVENRVWTELEFDTHDLTNFPKQRSFHSALIMGNYMVIYGGNTHIHHKEELCYDFEMYFYHLGCHAWVPSNGLFSKYLERRNQQGRVSHVALQAYGNLLLVIGGYAGTVMGDMVAFKMPSHIAPAERDEKLDLDFCVNYTRPETCDVNLDCFFCHNISTTSQPGCMHRSQEKLCATPISTKRAECPGICGRLSTCLQCLSQGQGASLTDQSPQFRTYSQPCNWCVKEASCQLRSKPQGTCSSSKDTVSGLTGWWGGISASLNQIDQCRLEDFPSGLQEIRYRSRVNLAQPDAVSFIRQTNATDSVFETSMSELNKDHIRWRGYIWPLNATVRNLVNNQIIYTLSLHIEKIYVAVHLGRLGAQNTSTADVVCETANEKTGCEFERRPDNTWLFPNRSRGARYPLEILAYFNYSFTNEKREGQQTQQPMYKLELEWTGVSSPDSQLKTYHPFTYEFLEPHGTGDCARLTNCLACMTDVYCGWCSPVNACVPRNTTTLAPECTQTKKQTSLLVTEPSVCPVCSDHVECLTCTQDPHCEWVKDYTTCVRRDRTDSAEVIFKPTSCPIRCHERTSCSSCLNKSSECAWCENLHTCLPFSDYVSRHRHGQCTEWIDNEVSNSNNPYTCRNCTALRSCDLCLKSFSCGWCGNSNNPRIGVCVDGDFKGPYGEGATCSGLVHNFHKAVPATEPTDWSYTECPDVEECRLGLHNCTENAICTNTPASFNCTCKRGYQGDGVESCKRTCYYDCVHGVCLHDVEADEFICDCNLGWTGPDCGTDCQCNFHSMCENGTGKCDFCLNNTMGPFCNLCLIGHYGDPTKEEGCNPCDCNDHGDITRGVCHNKTGECFCVHNTQGHSCAACEDGYYGDPRNGGKCYLSCDHGMVVQNITAGSVGSYKGPGVSTWRAYCLWIFTVYTDIEKAKSQPSTGYTRPPTITFGMEDLAVECEQDHVYVYDGIPKFIDRQSDGVLLAAYCGFYTGQFHSVVATSGIITVYFDADIHGNFTNTEGFNASYLVNACVPGCDETRNQICVNQSCICRQGYKGFPNCSTPVCETGCFFKEVTKSCQCEGKFDGSIYQINTFPWDAHAIHRDHQGAGPVSRYGHVTISCDDEAMYLFGGRSLKQGLLNDIWRYSYLTNTWTELKPITNERPSPRYFHTGACVSLMKNLFVFGGLVTSQDGQLEYQASKEMWKFAIDAKKWTGPIEPDWVVGLAGHSMTLVGRHKLFIIGGFSTEKYFSDTVYIYDANSYITAWETKRGENATGSKPVGIYGHSAIYNKASKTIYVYGGHIFDNNDRLQVSNRLFTYDVETYTWNVLMPEPNSQLEPRYFHQAVDMTEYMLVFGGYTDNRNTSTSILIYKFKCNFWFMLDLSDTSEGVHLTSLVSSQAVRYMSSMFVYGGFHNREYGALHQLTLPGDICTVHNSYELCQTQPGCYPVIVQENKDNQSYCYTSEYPTNRLRALAFLTKGPISTCDENWHSQRECEKISSCSECVAVYPQFKSAEPSCFWCTNCLVGRCIPQGYICEFTQQQQCRMIRVENTTSPLVNLPPECPISQCRASTCEHCLAMGCYWSRHFLKIPTDDAGGRRSRSDLPQYDWSCVPKQMTEPTLTMSPPLRCPVPCFMHHNCEGCLNSKGSEGGSQACLWSTALHECMPPVYVSLHCLGGECGTVLQGDSAHKCPVPCAYHTKCAACRRAQGCGWCAAGGENGKGECMPGTMSGPLEPNMCNTGTSSGTSGKPNEKIQGAIVPQLDPSWAYATCPSENECLNGHHNCDPETQDCEDREKGFVCRCKFGYISSTDINSKGSQICKPVCHQGCTNGRCVRPDRCECFFGFVGTNCSTKCECNGHSNCESVLKKDVCLNCQNNTQGRHCEMCKPLYVGDPRNGGQCRSCNEFCNTHTDICLYWTDYKEHGQEIHDLLKRYPDTSSFQFLSQYSKIMRVGPSNITNTYCINCQQFTHKRRCDECQPGYFRLHHMSATEPCTKCLCNGHSDTCDRNSGLNCACQNNTETRCNSADLKETNCHTSQCANCKEYFVGTPVKGHQCYRTMTVTKDYCFDPLTQLECTRNPRPLHKGRTVFFIVLPRYVNVDIRVTIDVTVGGLDVYFSTSQDTFIVDVDEETGVHTVHLDPAVTQHNRLKRRSADVDSRDHGTAVITAYNTDALPTVSEIIAKDVNTFITVYSAEKILIIRNVTDRLVLTLPNDRLDLKISRFFMVFRGTGDFRRTDTFGNVYFRQDQPHIDLFVFFSVFFSCFFLFLAMCVLLWKTKQGFDARRTRQQRAREMLHMASRPFAKVLALIEAPWSPYNLHSSPNLRNRTRKVTDRTPLLPTETGINMSPVVVSDSLTVSPIAIEPTDDGVAAVGTVIFRLPGGVSAPSYLCLGSTLTKGYQLVHPPTGKQRRQPPLSYC